MTAKKSEQTIEKVAVTLGDRSYDIYIGEKLMGGAGAYIKQVIECNAAIVITDENVAQFYLHRLTGALAVANIKAASVVLPAGEHIKCWEHLGKLLEKILGQAPDRKTAIIALGGGVIGDLAGMAASVALRGLPFIQVPTTLLAQVDSSVGGKTGVNTDYGKNTLGSFYQPKLVLIDTTTLQTLPKRELLAGYAEVIKYGLMQNAEFFHWLLNNGEQVIGQDPEALAYAVRVSCQSKAAIVAEDEYEQTGKRAWLNFGHTYAHALERECGYSNELLHGEAVAIGMVMALKLSATLGHVDESVAHQVSEHLTAIGLRTSPKHVREMWNVDALMEHMTHDKKAQGGKLTFVLSKGIGKVFVDKNVPNSVVLDVLKKELS